MAKTMVGVWHSGAGVGRANEVILRRARLVMRMGWVTIFGRAKRFGT